MKKKQLFTATLLIAFVFALVRCEKPQDPCRTCTAVYRSSGATIATKKACDTKAEDDFKSEYYYADVECKK
jgi:hypothetical protein